MNDIFHSGVDVISQAWYEAYDRIIDTLPEAVMAVLILIAGWTFATLARVLLLKFLGFFAVDKLAGKTPLPRLLRDAGIERTASEILSWLLFWLVMLFTLIFASEVLALTHLARALTLVTQYVPKIMAAFLIVIFGMLLAKFLQTLVVQSIGSTQRHYEKLAGKIVHAIVLIFVVIAALDQLEVKLSLVATNVVILLCVMLGVAGLALAIGVRPVLENAIACLQIQSVFMIGDDVAIHQIHGEIAGFTLTSVILKQDGRESFIPATTFLRERSERRAI